MVIKVPSGKANYEEPFPEGVAIKERSIHSIKNIKL
jgi:hypothetical protein